MKYLLFTVVLLFVSTSIFSQNSRMEQKAHQVIDIIEKTVDLTDAQETEIQSIFMTKYSRLESATPQERRRMMHSTGAEFISQVEAVLDNAQKRQLVDLRKKVLRNIRN